MSEKVLMKGNEALGEAALRAGCRHFFGYPITPQTELSAYLSKKMPKVGGTFLQAESEIAAINMVLGAAGSGVRAMTSWSRTSRLRCSKRQRCRLFYCAPNCPCRTLFCYLPNCPHLFLPFRHRCAMKYALRRKFL